MNIEFQRLSRPPYTGPLIITADCRLEAILDKQALASWATFPTPTRDFRMNDNLSTYMKLLSTLPRSVPIKI